MSHIGSNSLVGAKNPLDVAVVDSSGNQISLFGGSGGTASTDDAAFSIGAAASVTPAGFLADEVATDSVDEGDVGLARMTLDRKVLTRVVGATDANRLDVNSLGAGIVAQAGYQNTTWSTGHNPGANTKATITRASAGGSTKNVCTGFTVSLSAGTTAPAAVQITVALIDGASGGGTYLWGPTVISLPAVAGAISAFTVNRKWFVGTAATGMTLEFSAAGGANTTETVTMDGTTSL